MNDFASLFVNLDSTTKTKEKVEHLEEYISRSNDADLSWAIYFLTGRKIKRLTKSSLLRKWSSSAAGFPAWLFEECYDRVGDLAETISLILPSSNTAGSQSLATVIQEQLLPLKNMSEEGQESELNQIWKKHSQVEILLLGKILTGGFRVGVSKQLVIKALSNWSGLEPATISQRLMGDWQPSPEFYQHLISPDDGTVAASQPYPFFLAHPLKDSISDLGSASDWIAEWKWDGIRAQIIKRDGRVFIWSRGEELITDQFPEVADAAASWSDGTVVDGEILAWDFENDRPLGFQKLQRRLGRQKVGPKLLAETPTILQAFDLLEIEGQDNRLVPLEKRRNRLGELLVRTRSRKIDKPGFLFDELPGNRSDTESVIRLSESITATSWEELAKARSRSKQVGAEGVMLKRIDSTYQAGRPVGDWWKWKVDPFTVDAVLIYAQRGHGRRAGLYSDYTFAVWSEGKLVPFAKAYSGLTDQEMLDVDRFIKRNTKEKFGPVRSVEPELVFELAFENIQKSTRHKSGIAVRFPRISRWRHDKKPMDADHLDSIVSLIE